METEQTALQFLDLRGIERGIDLTKEKYINPITLAHKYYDDVYGEKFGGQDE